jgi:hypothetical protein
MSHASTAWVVPEPDAIPPELRTLPWTLWRSEPRGAGKPAKVPYCVAEPAVRASSTNPATWATFADAMDAYSVLADQPADPQRGPVAGVGVVLIKAAGIACIDLDRVVTASGAIDPAAARLVAHCDSWTEISPSGTGLHIFVRGTLPQAVCREQLEAYAADRYICITAHRWPATPERLRWHQPLLDRLVTLARGLDTPRRPYMGPSTPPPDDLAGALLARLAAWGVSVARLKRWSDGVLVELAACPWADEHTSGAGGAAVMIHASGALDFKCLHAHCARRRWASFRVLMESRG